MNFFSKPEEKAFLYSKADLENMVLKNFTFAHIYEIFSLGQTPIDEASLYINIPTHWKDIQIARIRRIQRDKNQEIQILCKETSSETAISNSVIPVDEGRKMYIDCSNVNTRCQTYHCKIGHLESNHTVARLRIKIDFLISEIAKGKKLIFFFQIILSMKIMNPM